MEEPANQIKKPKTHFFKLNDIVSIFVFIFLLSSAVCLCFYNHRLSNNFDRNYIFLLCNGILLFLIFNFYPTDVSSPKESQSVVTYKIKHQTLQLSSAMEQQQQEEIEEEIEEDDKDYENGSWGCVTLYYSDVSISQNQEMEHHVAVVEEPETGESKEAAKTEELNNRCTEFIRKMRERMRFESASAYSRLPPTK